MSIENNEEYQKNSKGVREAIRNDEGLYYGFQANIAMAFKDEFDRAYNKEKERKGEVLVGELDIHSIANNAAKNFLDLWTKDL